MNFLKILLFCLFFLCVQSPIYSQTIFGTVVDSVSKKPISLVNFSTIKNVGNISSDEFGFFKFKIGNTKDRIIVSALGYQSAILDLSEYSENKEYEINLSLSPVYIELENVAIYDKKLFYRTVSLPPVTAASLNRNSLKHSECILIKNNIGKTGFLKDVVVSFKSKSNNRQSRLTHFIFTFYDYNALLGLPGEQLEVVNIVGETKGSLGVEHFNFERYKVPFSVNGICMSLIVIDRDIEAEKKDSKQSGGIYKSTSALYTFSEKVSDFDTPSWVSNRTYQNEWTNEKFKYLTNNVVGLDLIFKVKVKIEKDEK